MISSQEKPFSQACENNKFAILEILKSAFANSKHVLEIGSGTGQHAVFFAPHLNHLQWHCADQADYHAGINAWIDDFPSDNLHRPVSLSIPQDAWPSELQDKPNFDAYYSANTAHIMQKDQVQYLMKTINELLPANGVFCQYGPFTQNGNFSSQSNADFHAKLIASGYGGYRDLKELQRWAPALNLVQVNDMPANNLLLVWHRK